MKIQTKKIALISALSAICAISAAAGIALSASVPQSIASAETTALRGEGTYTHPYIISDESELSFFASDVNGGNSYAGKYVKQTASIDMSGVDFTPIGACGGGSYFDGVYMGGGHTIYNLTVTADNAALFGTLNGEVYALTIKGGNISGEIAAGIAVNAEDGSDAIIADCYADVTLEGKRASAMADDLADGCILNCVSACKNADGAPAAICAQSAGVIELCYSMGAVYTGGENTTEVNDCSSYCKSKINGENFYKTLNANNDLLYRRNTIYGALAAYGEGLAMIADDGEENVYFTDGNGGKYNPYKINTASDLVSFSRYVNGGEEFRQKYVKQTADISLDGAEFIPIGIYDGGSYFYGVYDGGGHVISDFRITTLKGSANNGMFGMLGGKLINLGLKDGFISGTGCASFASHAADVSAIIANCYSTVSIEGMRSGGIADNFIGYIIGCWYFNDEQALPIVSYNAQAVKYCQGNYLYLVPETFTGEERSNHCIEMKIFSQDDFKDTITGNLAFVSYETGIELYRFTQCYSTEYANIAEQLILHPVQSFYAYRFIVLPIIIAAGCVVVIIVTIKLQRRKRRNESKQGA